MDLNWETFKSALGLSSNTSVFYIDDEESKIPIDSECEFQEALRLAKLNKNSLKLVFHGDKPIPNEMCVDQCQSVTNPVERCGEVKMRSVNAVSQNSCQKENTCNCHGNVPPEWFTHYMKKFKKEIIHELKSHIHDTVHSAVEKNLSYTKSDTAELFCERNENPFSPISTHTKKKKKLSERDLTDLIDQRQIRLPKKYGMKPERLELLDQKTRTLLEERRRLLESRHHSKSKLDKNCFLASGKNFFFKKSASFAKSCVYLTLPGESEFDVTVNVTNDGLYEWHSPALVCFESKGVFLEEYRKPLPILYPRGSCSTKVRGKLSNDGVPCYFKCRVVDREVENISPEFICRINVMPNKFGNEAVKETDGASTQLQDNVETLIDFKKDLIASSQKKIEENISEIERRLHDIELLQPTTSGMGGKESNFFQMDWRVAQEEMKDDPAGGVGSGECNMQNENQMGMQEKEVNKSCEKMKKDGELESSDSELSIVFMSEEEDNFFVVPSESLSTAESASEGKKFPNTESTVNANITAEEPATVAQQPVKPEARIEMARQANKDEAAFQTSPTRLRCSPFAEEISKPKKMKSKSTKYRFTAANLTQPTFTQIPGFFEGRPSRFTFTGEKEEKPKEDVKNTVPETDALGRVIYAVNSSGRCLPVKGLFKREDDANDQPSESQQQKRNDDERLNDTPSVAILPNALINGASNVASLAFNTAKSVINNLQSAFVTEGKTEMGQPAYQDKVKVSAVAMSTLHEMGFLDKQKNRTLLRLHNNDVIKVIDELVRLNESAADSPQ